MKRKLHRIVAFALAFIMTWGSMGLTFPVLVNATGTETENEALIGNSFHIDFTDITGDELDRYFTAGKITSSGGTINLKPSDLFTSDKNPTGNTQSKYQNDYLKTKVHNKGLSVLTLKDTTATNFKVSLEMLNTYTVVGMFFGTDDTPANDIKMETNNIDPDFNSFKTSGFGHVHQLEQNGRLFVQGIDANSSKWEDSSCTLTMNKNTNYVRTRNNEGLPNFDTTVNNTTLHTLNIEVINGTIKVWWDGFEQYAWTSKMLSTYKGGAISIYMNGCEQGGVKSFSFDNFDGNYQKFYKDFTKVDASELDGYFTAGNITSSGGTINLKPSDLFTSDKNPTGNTQGKYQNDYLKTKVHNKGLSVLTLKDTTATNFKVSLEMLNTYTVVGMFFGTDGTPANDIKMETNNIDPDFNSFKTSGFGHVHQLEQNGRLFVQGIDANSSKWEDSTNKDGLTFNKNTTYVRTRNNEGLPNFDTTVNNTVLHTLNIEVLNGTIKVWWDGFEQYAWTSQMLSTYKGGAISIYMNGCEQGGIKSFAFEKIEDPLGDIANQFDAYYLEDASQSKQLTSVDVKDKWTKSGEFLVAKKENTGNDTKNVDVLTFKSQSYKDFEMTFTYQQSWQRLGVLLGLEKGEYPISQYNDVTVAEGGVMFYLEAEGTPVARGDFENGYTNTKQVMRRLTGLGLQNFTDGSGNATTNVNNKVEHTVKIVVKDYDLYVYVDQYTEPVMYLALPETYNSGYVSLFSAANKNFGFKDFTISETITTALPEKETGANVYEVDFTKLHGIKELNNDFTAYTLNSTENKSVETTPSSAFTIVGNGIRRNAESQGGDWGGFNILTLKNKEYKNFELELVYAQSWIRYGVMVGGELGEFAYSGKSGECRGTHGVAFAYTEAEGHRNVKGGLTAGMTNYHNYALQKLDTKIPGFDNLGSVEKNVNAEVLHTMKVRVVGEYMTIIIDGNEASRLTTRIDGYEGGYISLVTNGSATGKGLFNYLKITELDDNALLGTEEPTQKDGFTSLKEMSSQYDAYYLSNAGESTTMQSVDLIENWWFNAQGFVSRYEKTSGSEYKDVDVLTYKKQAYSDFQVDFEIQQTYNRTGIIIGTEKGEFPLALGSDGKLTANGGVMLFVEAEGITNAMGGFTNGYTNMSQVRRRITQENLPGFLDSNGSAEKNVNNKKTHKITIVVKNKELYMFVNGSEECALYLTLPDSYKGGYISLFSSAGKEFGLDKFEISETITKTIPKKQPLVTQNGKEINISFDAMIPDTTGLSTYYLRKLDDKGTVSKTNFYDKWMVANGKLNRQSDYNGGSDVSDVAVMTYTGKKYTDFVATFEYQQSWGRLMFLFGGQNGKYPLYDKEGHFENGGVILYPEADLGNGGGICALGNVKIATEGYRPLYREIAYAPGYYTKDTKMGTTYKMTVAVINKHCSVYIDGFGLVASFDLNDNYKGGYISLASAMTEYQGFMNLQIKEINSANAIKDVNAIKDITVKKGTALKNISLPTSVKVTTSKGTKINVPVVWEDRGYNANEIGEYQFVGTLNPGSGVTNPGMMTALLTVRVRNTVANNSGAKKLWTFDTNSDLLDFQSFYVEDATKGKAVKSDYPAWFVRNGKLQKDINRSTNGSASQKLNILTYTGKKYKNFELEVDFTQQYVREMIMFGSQTPGQYIDYADPKNPNNPICVFVEYEGRRNAIGNVVNTNYYTRLEEHVANLREDYSENDNYYTKNSVGDNLGEKHHMKIRVVGDTVSIWLDNQKTVFSGKINESYKGGYISLVSTSKDGWFDNLSITELDENGNPVADGQDAKANGTLNVDYKLVNDEEKVAVAFEFAPWMLLPILTAVSVMAVVVIIMVARKQSKKKKEGNS